MMGTEGQRRRSHGSDTEVPGRIVANCTTRYPLFKGTVVEAVGPDRVRAQDTLSTWARTEHSGQHIGNNQTTRHEQAKICDPLPFCHET